MTSKGNLYKIVAVLVSLGMLLQIFIIPVGWFGNGVSTAEGAKSDLFGEELADLSSELAGGVGGIGVMGADGQPDRILMDAGFRQQNPLATQPEVLANPLSLSRVQSTYQAGGTAVVTFTVKNNRPPTLFPTIPASATVTETAQIIAGFDITADPNTIRNVIVTNSLTGSATYLDASPFPDRQGSDFVWKLGDLPPQASRSLSMELQLPGTAGDFIDLDTGATAYGTLQGRLVAVQGASSVLAPDGFAQWLVWTPDADIYDEYMLVKAGDLDQDSTLMFEYVRSLSYEVYTGSLRGTLGTLWSEAGNSADQASLLIAMLRASGIPARYRHGSLNTADAQQLIGSMFPTPNQIVGHVPENAVVSDPVNDAELIAEAQDHWWVEAYLPGSGWTDLDPAFASAQIGDSFAIPAGDGTDQIAELPDDTRHKVHLTLEVEQYSEFPVAGTNLSMITPLTATLNSVELVGNPVNLSFLIETDSAGGLAFGNVIHTYNPYINFGLEDNIYGQPFSDLLTNFPLASTFTTGIWLTVETETPDGEITAYEREIKDRIGVEGRVNGGVIDLEPIDDTPFINQADSIHLQVVPQSKVPRSEVSRALANVMANSTDMGQAFVEYDSLDLEDTTSVLEWIDDNAATLQPAQLAMFDMLGTAFYAFSTASDRPSASSAMLVKSYPDAPKLLLMSQSAITDTIDFSFELLNIRERSLAYPGQSEEAVVAANLSRTLGDKAIEFALLEELNFEKTESAYEIVLEAIDADIPIATIGITNLGDLSELPISEEAKARITLAIQDGNLVFVPTEQVMIDGESRIGWLEVDDTGHGSFVNEKGQRASALEYALQVVSMFTATGHGAALLTGIILTLVLFVANIFGYASSLTDYALGQAAGNAGGKWRIDLAFALAGAAAAATEICSATAPFVPDCFGGVVIAVLLISPLIMLISVTGDPSLPPMLGNREVESGGLQVDSIPVTVPASSGAGSIAVSAETTHVELVGAVGNDWSDSNQHGLMISSLTANNVDVYQGGLLLDSGSIEFNGLTAASLTGTSVSYSLDAAGTNAFLSPAVNGLGIGTDWTDYTADISSAQPYTITLADATVTVDNSSTFSGTLEVVVSGSSQISGPESSPVPQFNSNVTSQLQSAGLNIGPLTGSVLADGIPFPASNGIAVSPFNGPITVTESTTTTDLVEFTGTADFFSLSLSPASSTVTPTEVVAITPVVEANFADTYTFTVEAPVGWTVDITDTGEITALPPAGAAPADYTILVTAQSSLHPELFVSAIHTVTVLTFDGMDLSIVEDTLITMPMGPVDDPSVDVPVSLGHIVNGRAEIPGAAYTILVTNTSTSGYSFDVTVSGLPADWSILSNAGQSDTTTLDLGAGEIGQVGLYISPTVSTLMAPGTNYTIDVNAVAQGNPSLDQDASILFTMPGLAFPYPKTSPNHQYVTEGNSLSIDVSLTNVGNVAGSFPVTATVQGSAFTGVSIEPTPITSGETWTTPVLNPGETDNATIAISTTGLIPGQVYIVIVESQQSEFQPATFSAFTVASLTAGPIFEAADETANACTAGEPGLSAALRNLGLSVSELEASCGAGSCSLFVKDEVVDALNNVVFYSDVSPLVTADSTLSTLATDLAGHTDDVDIQNDIVAISAAVTTLETEVCEISEHTPAVTWLPAYNAGLVGQPVSYTLQVENQGTVTTTYAVTVALPSGTTTFNTNLGPGKTSTTEYAPGGGVVGLYDLTATARATGPDVLLAGLQDEAEATLNVVDKFIQLTAVTADPNYVETGTSSTNISIDVANIANIPWDATAETQILAPGGGVSHMADIPLTILVGNPKNYPLTTVNTSGWAAGLYTVTVNLVDGDGNAITEGSGYGYFGVGQALGVSQSVEPVVVAPGIVTVTTVLTTEILAGTIISSNFQEAPAIQPRVWEIIDETAEHVAPTLEPEAVPEEVVTDPRIGPGDQQEEEPITISASLILTTTGITRTEQDEPSIAYTGTWQAITAQKASSSGMVRADDPGDSAEFTFTGMEVSLGFLGGSNGAIIEVFIDGASQGLVDLYRREDTPLRFTFDNFITGTHTISFTHSGTTNPNATNDFVQFDYIDVRDGMLPADGTFEQDDTSRVFSSNTWGTLNSGTASGGTYYRDPNATIWFPFSGDSVTYHYLLYNNGGVADIYIDNQWVTRVEQYNISLITETISFDGLGPGFHMMMVTTYRGQVSVDAFKTPGTPPFYTTITPTGFTRFEDDNPALLYNGLPFTVTNPSWTRQSPILASAASSGQHIYSNTQNDTVSLTFDGIWVSVGFYMEDNTGMAEVFVDGVSQGIIDTYSNEDDITSFTVDGLITGTHTISVTVLDMANPLASNTRVSIDYIDVWDGTSLGSGKVEQDDPSIFRSAGLVDVVDADASGGTYVQEGLNTNTTVWFPFEGDSITYQAFDYFQSEKVAVYIDEQFQGYYEIYTEQAPTITHSFDGLGSGLHVIKVRRYRDELTLDAFITPAIEPSPPAPTPTTFTRHEEDAATILYNGLPYNVTNSSWNRSNNVQLASDGQYIDTTAVGNSISFDFNGTWVGLGFVTNRFGGQVEVFVDGVSQGIVDMYTRDDDVLDIAYGGLADSNHTVSMTLLATNHPNSSGTSVKFDYYETWDGSTTPAGTYEEVSPEVKLGDYDRYWDYFVEPAASGGQFINDGFQRDSTAWFPFTGDSVTFLGLANSSGDRVQISIDGVVQGTYNLYNNTPITRAFTFDGLGAGPHMMQVQSNRSELNVDAFVVPGLPSFTQTSVITGLVRYEEDHPDLVYNGQWGFEVRPQSWTLNKVTGQVSGRWHVHSNAVSDTVSLEFFGPWAAVGFRTRNQVGTVNIFVDGVNMGLFAVQNPGGEDTTVIPIGGLITGTHTISVSVASGTIFFDYIDVWDGQPVTDDLQDLRRSEDNPRLHYSASLIDIDNDNAIEDAFMATTLLNTNSNIWYTFVGDAFTFIGFSRANTTFVELFVDGVFIETIDVEYPYSPQPISFHYDGFGPGPHVVRIHNGLTLRADAFQSNPAIQAPYSPIVEWYDTTGNGSTGSFGTPAGMLMGIAAGDVTGDGLVEIVAPSDTYTTGGQFMNSVLIYRGDGQDTGDGDPLINRIDFPSLGTGLGRETIGSVALADLDGLPGAEIIIGTEVGMYAFRGDGATLWFTDTYQALILNATPAVGNLDFDDTPEIVVNMDTDLVVYEADGDIAWATSYTSTLGTPLLADLTNDGRLDIIIYDSSGKMYAYDYNFGSPTLLWQTQLSSPVVTVRGGPAVTDLDGDGMPEIAMTHDGAHTVLDKDGNVFWSTPLDPGAAGGVSIADIDGDLEPEIVTGIKYDDGVGQGRLYALNADGSILWDVPAYDNTSANSQSVLDINGDGVYEIAWNGADLGFTIFNGTDGSILFNEPLAESLTGTDYPIFADVDMDGFAEVVAPTNDGIVVIGHDYVWGESRPIWNQHTYHITNINDDMSVPFSEANSWDVHNTYRTQWPEAVVLPVYDVTLTHTVGITGVAVVSSTFSVSPTNAADPVYGWDYTQTWADTYVTRTFDSVLTGLQPGESRLVAQGTEVAYELPSGINYLTLPPMYVSVPHIISVAPVSLTVGAGGTAVFDIVLDNPALASDTYTLTVAGLSGSWLTYPAIIPVGAGSQVTVSLTVDVPDTAAFGNLFFSVIAVNSSGGQDQAGAELIVIDGLEVSIDPDSQVAEAGTAVTYTLTVSNNLATAQTYNLNTAGGAAVTLPPTMTVPAGSSANLPVAVSAATNGTYPFTISADNDSGADSDSAVLEATGDLGVGISLVPATAEAGPLTPAVFTVTVTNLGSVPDTYDLDVSLPAGWTYEFKVNGSTITSLALQPAVFNSADVLLLVTPDSGASPGTSDISVSTSSQTNVGVSDSVTGTVDVQNRGVDIAITPQSSTMLPTDTGIWQVTITNTGSVADSYWLTMTGFIGPYGSLAGNLVALNAGQSTTVQLTADNLDFMLPGTYQFAVAAESQNNALIQNEAIADVTFEEFEAVDVAWIPVSQTVTDTLTATYIMVISNTGNVATTYSLGLNLPVSLTGQLAVSQLPLPPHITGFVVVDVQASGAGTYLFDGTADSATSPATDSSTATLEVVLTNLPPSANAGGDETADEGELINFNGAASDPEGQPLEILWDFGDGNTAGGTLTPTHAYDDNGTFVVTLVVTDNTGLSSSDTLTATINNVAPSVNAGANQNAFEGDTIFLDPATFTDPGSNDTHTATINWGDGTVEAGTVNQGAGTVSGSHVYEDNGSYTVTVIVNDDDGGQGSDSFSVTVANVAPQVNAGNDQTADEGDTVSLDPATFIDSGANDTHTATIDWGDGVVEAGTVDQAANTVSGSHDYQDNGIFTVTVTVTDDDGDSDDDTFTVTVNNVAPTVNAGVDQNVNVGDTVSLDPATFTDPGGDDTHTAMIDWGDGTVEAGTVDQGAGTVSGSHVYTAPGTYTVTVTVIDDDGGQSSDTFTVVVTGPTMYFNYVPAVYK